MKRRVSAKGKLKQWLINSAAALEDAGFSGIRQDWSTITAMAEGSPFRIDFTEAEGKVFLDMEGDTNVIDSYMRAVTCVFKGITVQRVFHDSAVPSTPAPITSPTVPAKKKDDGTLSFKIPEQYFEYCRDNGYGPRSIKRWTVRNFDAAMDSLAVGEKVLFAFIGLHNYISFGKSDGECAYMLTDQRLIAAQRIPFKENVISIYYSKLNDIIARSGALSGVLVIDSLQGSFKVFVGAKEANAIYPKIQEVLARVHHGYKVQEVPSSAAPTSTADELLKFKQLLDMGVITQAEFEQKKRELL